MKKRGILHYVVFCFLLTTLLFSNVSTAYATETGNGQSISDLLSGAGTDNSTNSQQSQGQQSQQQTNSSNNSQTSGNSTIDGIVGGLDVTQHNTEFVQQAGNSINHVVGQAINVLAYAITAGLTLTKVLDLAYIVIPFTRKFLANGYMGNAAASGTEAQGGMMGANPMGGGMMGAGPMGGGMMGGPMGGMGGMRGGRYGMQGGMMGAGGMDQQMAMQNQPSLGRIQFVSNAALNAVATESVLGTDGKGQSAFKLYLSDMIVSSVATGICLVLCITGIMAKFGFMLGNFAVEVIQGINF